MGHEFLIRVRRTSIITTLVVFVAVSTYMGFTSGLSWVAGCAWSLINLHLIGILVREVVNGDERENKLRIFMIAIVKIPVLYAAGGLLLTSGWFVPLGLLAGFMWPLLVTVMKAVGRLWMKMDEDADPATGMPPLRATRKR